MLLTILTVISLLFVLFLIGKQLFGLRFCVLCASVNVTWIGLLVLYKTGYFHDRVLLALLIGQSVTGVFYMAGRHVAKPLRIFALPFFLTLTSIAYVLIQGLAGIVPAFSLLLGLWLAAYVIFAWRNDSGKKSVTDAFMNCCEDK